jgi:hypothetical protein
MCTAPITADTWRCAKPMCTAPITADTWRFWNDTRGFSQRFTGTLSDDDNAINGAGELSHDADAAWEHDLAITYRRIG